MQIHQPIKVLISVLYHYSLTTTKLGSDESHDESKLITSRADKYLYIEGVHSLIHKY